MVVNNEFETRKEVIFIEYDGVMKSSNQYLIYKLGNDLYEDYKDILDLETIKGCSMDQSLAYCFSLRIRNPIMSLYRGDDSIGMSRAIYHTLFNKYPEMYEKCYPLSMYSSVDNLRHQKFVDHIYIYHPFDDDRVIADIFNTIGYSDNMTFVYGDLEEVLDNLDKPVTAFMLTDIHHTDYIWKYKYLNYIDISVAKYIHNYKRVDGNLEPLRDLNEFAKRGFAVRQTLFTPYDFMAHHGFNIEGID